MELGTGLSCSAFLTWVTVVVGASRKVSLGYIRDHSYVPLLLTEFLLLLRYSNVNLIEEPCLGQLEAKL